MKLVTVAIIDSVSKGFNFVGWFRVQFPPGTESSHWVLPYENPDGCNFASFTLKYLAFQYPKFGTN
jgi:hypothetical protein